MLAVELEEFNQHLLVECIFVIDNKICWKASLEKKVLTEEVSYL